MRTILLIIFGLGVSFLQAQSISSYIRLPQSDVANLIYPTPEAAQLIRYVDHPVSYFSGTAEITVPLYTVKGIDIELPVYLSYHSSGIKVTDVSGSVGLGWSLNAGGVISKVVNGLPDHYRSFAVLSNEEVHQMEMENKGRGVAYLSGALMNVIDTKYDRYYYNCAGMQGSFIYDPMTKKVTQIPITDREITVTVNSAPPIPIYSFTIRDTDGTEYNFSEFENIKSKGPQEPVIGVVPTDYATTSTWYLTSIVPYYNQEDVIEIEYNNAGAWRKADEQTITSTTLSYMNSLTSPSESTANKLKTHSIEYSDCKIISEIRFKGGKLLFSYASDRKDRGLRHRLSGISIYSDVLLKKISFNNNSYFGDGRLKLSGVEIRGAKGTLMEKKKFEYIDESTKINWYARDRYGYYNGKNNINLALFDFKGNFLSNRDYSFTHARTYLLNKIVNEAGGTTTFNYEANMHKSVAIGVRIAGITTNEDINTPEKTRRFEYEQSCTSIDFNEVGITSYMFQSGILNSKDSWNKNELVQTNSYHSNSVLPGVPVEDARIYYGKVSETVTDMQSGEKIKVTYEFDTLLCKNRYHSLGTVYDVTSTVAPERRTLGTNLPGSTALTQKYNLNYARGCFAETGWAAGNLLKKTTYKYENNRFVPTEIETNTYQQYKKTLIQVGLNVQSYICLLYYPTLNRIAYPHKELIDFTYAPLYAESGYNKLKSTNIQRFHPSGTKEENISYLYNDLDLPPKSGHPNTEVETITYSDGNKVYQRNYYYADGLNQIYSFFPKEVLLEELLVDGIPVESTRKDYSMFTTEIIKPAPPEGGLALVKGVKGLKYATHTVNGVVARKDSINARSKFCSPISISKQGEPESCYIWGYSGKYPLAEIKNMKYSVLEEFFGGLDAIQNFMTKAKPTQADLDLINSMRGLFPDAMITTFTYDILVGVTSITDPSGRKKSFEYDDCGRLIRTRDDKNNIVEELEYFIKEL